MDQKLRKFLFYLEHEKKTSLKTISCYKEDTGPLLDYLKEMEVDLKDVDRKVMLGFLARLNEKGQKNTTIARKIAAWRNFFDFCIRESWISINPAKVISLPKIERNIPSFLTEKEAEEFVAFPIIALRDYAILEILYATGISTSELTRINLKNIESKERAIVVKGNGKRKKDRVCVVKGFGQQQSFS